MSRPNFAQELFFGHLRRSTKYLDLGCGSDGGTLERLSKYVHSIHGVDLRPPDSVVSGVTWVKGDIIDFVHLRLVLQFLPKESARNMLQKLVQHVAPQGRIRILTWYDLADRGFPAVARAYYTAQELSAIFPFLSWRVLLAEEFEREEKKRGGLTLHTFRNTEVIAMKR